MNTNNYLTLTDSRQLCYAEYGATDGEPVMYFHGMPSSRLEAALLDQTAQRLGFRIIAPDRPGFGQSTFQPKRRIIDTIEDIRQLSEQLQLQYFHVLGLSGGCPYALACSWGLPEQVIQTSVMAGLGEFVSSCHANEMPMFARITLQAAARFPRTIQSIYGTLVATLVKNNTSLLQYLLGSHSCEADRAAWKDAHTAELFSAALQEAFSQGGQGSAYELTLLSKPWGFRTEEIAVPLTFWHGGQDKTVPASMGQEQHARTRNSTLEILPDEGHFSLPVKHMERILRGFTTR